MIKVLFFASLREQLGVESEQLPAEGLLDVAGLMDRLRDRGGVWEEAFNRDHTIMMAVNQEVADGQTPIGEGDEIAFFPPVTGG